MFGKGVYFADMVSKSAQYCYSASSLNRGYLFLCDVALGNKYELKSAEYISKLPNEYQRYLLPLLHSTHGLGRVSADYSKMDTIDGVEFPGVGKPKETNSEEFGLQYNEFIVYNTKQIKIKYLIDLQFS